MARVTKKSAIESLTRILVPTYRDHGQRGAEEMLSELRLTAVPSSDLETFFVVLDLEGADHTRLMRSIRRELSA